MKRFLNFFLIALTIFACSSFYLDGGKRPMPKRFQFGDVKIVDDRFDADLRIFVTKERAQSDYVVKLVDFRPTFRGEWRFVTDFPKFKVFITKDRLDADMIIFFDTY